MTETPSCNDLWWTEIAAIVGAGNVSVEITRRREFSNDLFGDSQILVGAVVAPAGAEDTSAVVKYAVAKGLTIAPRGAGLSYSDGYAPVSENSIALDLSRMNTIDELNSSDLYVVAGAGSTWQQIHDATTALRLRPVIHGPISGSASTLGGAASQNILGSMHGFIGLEVVLPDGRILNTGSRGKRRMPSSFYRHFGPDITGLFLGDAGIFGIKTKVVLQLEKMPAGVAMASFSFSEAAEMAHVMAEVARQGLCSRSFGTDPIKSRTASNVSFSEAVSVVKAISYGGPTIAKGLSNALKVVRSGRSALDDTEWSLHLHCEGFDQQEADKKMEAVRRLCLRKGREISANVAIALNARPYSTRGFVGLNGERWVPVHGIFPLSRASEAAHAVIGMLEKKRSELYRLDIETCCCMFTSGSMFAIEPMFYWSDELGPLHQKYLPEEKFRRFRKTAVANPEARATVDAIRNEIRDMFFAMGAVHCQIGRYYDFGGAVGPETTSVLAQLKNALDDRNVLNPGNFGLS